ncbi:hypothetical protein GNI_071990 [Gregarina niphandrodes]|uniref:Transmembrane protein n=1 Tax=Gregarina niphandrodes TaxID=110365 RepID=A0A023B788_GRENI|nr:hypothetical protein GNI_071990 [Gregarina niphandrodes]EZG67087.1 hypothetical protein GNI_071990 [Gregarina niphandrodes]|eukprot:XP_011130341.1 hypothetical protein GNI_071990 [Gregarina niphandrodes]
MRLLALCASLILTAEAEPGGVLEPTREPERAAVPSTESEPDNGLRCLHSTDLISTGTEVTAPSGSGVGQAAPTMTTSRVQQATGAGRLRRTLSDLTQQTVGVAEAKLCYASQVKKTLKRRAASLPVASSAADVVAQGVEISRDYFGDAERVYLNVICNCNVKPSLPGSGNYAASLVRLSEVDCVGMVPNTRVSYNLTNPGTCFAGAVRQSYQARGAVSRLFLDTSNQTTAGNQTSGGRLNVRNSADLVFRAGEFKLGPLGYYSVCNKDPRIQNLDHVNLFQEAKKVANEMKQPTDL